MRFSLANRRGDSEEPEEGVEQVTCESRGTQNINSATLSQCYIHNSFFGNVTVKYYMNNYILFFLFFFQQIRYT